MNKYVDFDLIKKVPNKYNLTPKLIKRLNVLDWNKLQEFTWHNSAMEGEWWCHIEGCNDKEKYDNFDEFWIGFNKVTDEVDYWFTTWEGLGSYEFDSFYNIADIENKADMMVQVNAMRFLNKLLDEKIVELIN